MDLWRELREVAEVTALYPGSQSFVHDGRPGVHVPQRGSHWITVICGSASWVPPCVYIRPEPEKSHYYYAPEGESAKRLCLAQPGEWFPHYRLLTAVSCGVRFLNEYLAGGAR